MQFNAQISEITVWKLNYFHDYKILVNKFIKENHVLHYSVQKIWIPDRIWNRSLNRFWNNLSAVVIEMSYKFYYSNFHTDAKASTENGWIYSPDWECQNDIVHICVYFDCIVYIAESHIIPMVVCSKLNYLLSLNQNKNLGRCNVQSFKAQEM